VKALCKHRQIYQTLVIEIADHRYDATGRLPSEVQLMRRFGVSRPTAARALRDLQSEGVVERRVGAGSFRIKGVKPSNPETTRHLGILLPDIGITELLAAFCGNRRIAFVARPLSAPTVLARMTGARNALFDAGLEIPKDFYRIGNPRDAKFVRDLTLGRKVDAVICANDLTAAQLMNSLAKLKIRVPEDMRLIGFDNLEYAELLAVPLTTIAQPDREMASNAMRAMRSRLIDPSLPPTTLLSTPSIVVRCSCGAFLQR
jgi:hypothetical protein